FLSGLPKNLIYSKIGLGDIENTALILFTSGSESEPKAVELSHKNISSNVIGAQESFQLKSDDSILAILPLFHVFGQTTTVWLPFYSGLQITTYSNPLHAKTIVRIIREVKPALITATPAFFMSYLRASKKGDFSSVRLAIVGADKTPTWLREHYQEQHQVHLYDGYGTTETSPVISANTPLNHREGSVGKPFPDVRVKIVHIHTEEEVTSGQEGKILVKGDLVMKGYYGDFEQTNLRIHNGWYETGDIGKFDENGFLWHCGRLKRFVKIAGEMVSLVTIESHLEAFLPDDTECCVVDIPDPKRGAKIIVVLTKEINQQMITEQLSKHLPNIAIPKTFLTLPELPKASSGKMDFRKVAEIVQEKLKLG
ncbi:MAG: acyl-[acyl-carrier-protein]-phospholipid O-acyltransferase, partial [bacterium]